MRAAGGMGRDTTHARGRDVRGQSFSLEIMTADPVTVPASATVTRFLHDLLPWLRHSAFPGVDDGQTVGLVTVRRGNQVPADDRDRTTLREVACPLAEVARATPDEPVADLLPRLN